MSKDKKTALKNKGKKLDDGEVFCYIGDTCQNKTIGVFEMNEPRTLAEILAILRRHKSVLNAKFGVLDLAVFGSYARQAETVTSDVDLLVDMKTEYKTFDNYMELKFFLEEELQKKIDLAIKESIREELQADIFKEAVYA